MSNSNPAVGFFTFGGPEVLEVMSLPMPQPEPGEALIRVHAATVNPTDTLLRSGALARVGGAEPPYVPGMELAGEVIALGSDSDSTIEVGTRVAAVVSPWGRGGGAQAQYVCVDLRSMVAIPDTLSYTEAATVPMNGLTAVMVLNLLHVDAGEFILVTGGAGALGGYLLSIASRRGHRVIADALDSDRELLDDLGAHVVVPRGAAMADAVRAVAPAGVAGLVDAARLGAGVSGLVREGGVFIQVRGDEPAIDDHRIRTANVSVPTQIFNTELINEVMNLAASGVIRPRIAEEIALTDVAEAHRRLEEGGLRGRLVLKMPVPD